MPSNILKGTPCVKRKWSRPLHISQIQWKCPLQVTIDSTWQVVAGNESAEAASQKCDATDLSDSTDCKTPVIPSSPIEVKEEGSLQNESSVAFLTTSMKSEQQQEVLSSSIFVKPEPVKQIDAERSRNDLISIAMIGAAAALTAYELRHEQTSIDVGLLMQFLMNPEMLRKRISEQSVPGIGQASMLNKSTPGVASVSPNPDDLKVNTSATCVLENTGAIISDPNAGTSSVSCPSCRHKQDVIDIDLLAKLLNNPAATDKLIEEYDSSSRSGILSGSTMMPAAVKQSKTAIATTLHSPPYSRATTSNEHSSPLINTVPLSVPRMISSSVSSASTKMTLSDEALASQKVTMAPMAPLYFSPCTNLESDLKKAKSLIKEHGPVDGMRREPSPTTRITSPRASISLPQVELSELPRARMQPVARVLQSRLQKSPISPDVHGCSGVVGQGLSTPRPLKTCIYFNTHRGCWNGTSCPYLHIISDQPEPSRVEIPPSAKRMKLG